MKYSSLMVVLALAACEQATAAGRLADVSIVDRDTGGVLPLHSFRGEYWVAGKPGHRYSIQIANRQENRILAITSVDGLNVLTGAGAGFNQRGYVYMPWQSYEITGWRKSSAEVAAFTFTAVANSYAARTGRPDNVGVIGVALFRERLRPVLYESMPSPPLSQTPSAARADSNANGGIAADSRAAPKLETSQLERKSAQLGTGHGQREQSWVQSVEFERESSQPNEIIRIRYDSYENLLAMGVIRRVPPVRGRPEAFPGETVVGYVPDP